MFYSFSVSENGLQSLILNGSLLYSVEDKDKKLEFDLNDKERFVFEFLVENSSREFPSSPRDIEAAYKKYYDDEFGLYALKNTIASLRKKYKQLIAGYDGDMDDKELIVNVFKKGYYIDLERIENNQIKESIVNNFNSYKPTIFSMLKTCLEIYHLSILNKAAKALLFSGLILVMLYMVQVLHLTSIVERYSLNTDKVTKNLMLMGCHDHNLVSAFNDTLNLDSAIVLSDSQACLVDRERAQVIDKNSVEALLNLPQFVYTTRENATNGTLVLGRISANAVSNRYSNNLWPVLIDSMGVNNKVEDVFKIGDLSGVKVYAVTLDNGTRVAFYSQNLFYEWASLCFLYSLLFYGKRMLRFSRFCHDWYSIRFKLEKIVDTDRKTVLYHEILTRVKHRSALQYIANLAATNLVTLHTVLIAKTIQNSRQAGEVGVYGVNICPSSLQNRNFHVLEKYLLALEPNEVVLEVTENSKLAYNKEIYANIRYLKSLGFLIALDDFGTGNNNVEIVHRVSPNYLKVDKEFIHGIESNEVKKRLLVTLSDIGVISDCQIIQEGVETITQQEVLSRLGCRLQQGYLYS
ncbi:EAL domain-containing protein [Vibrio coralliilyticus]|uniref:EAL domain-containing protein n=1 Tax=Vibrio coralliilyticus TaxID=190893 RepID=UPI0005129401|nr:EAL domain-containing protein [Vibrio coralliilyticus]AIS57980.1 diguanylate cyclase [Vibrio coralliilyticus]